MKKQKGTTPLQKWIEARRESAQNTAEFLHFRNVKVSREAVRRWQTGDRKPSRELLAALAAATGLTAGDLIK
jgi:transcriptional regulator with XRE-family HTH domain